MGWTLVTGASGFVGSHVTRARRLSGVEPPAVKLPLAAVLAAARVAEALPGRPPFTEAEIHMASLWWAYRSTKAKRELGYAPAHHEATLERTIAWCREREPLALKRPGTHQPVALRVAGFGLRRAGELWCRLGLP